MEKVKQVKFHESAPDPARPAAGLIDARSSEFLLVEADQAFVYMTCLRTATVVMVPWSNVRGAVMERKAQLEKGKPKQATA